MNKRQGFTLIELLVVIAIIALLMAIVMPGLNLAKKKAAQIVCMSNVKNLSLGWFCYQEDNNGNIMSAKMNGITVNGKKVPGWINIPQDISGGSRSNTDTTPVLDDDEIRGVEKGALYPYLKSTDVFNCPADKVKSIYDLGEKFVTYAVARCLAGSNNSPAPADARILKFSEITSPGMRYNFVETAQERNYQSWGWLSFGAPEWVNGGPAVWWDPMAVNHGDSSVLGFCDGHAEVKKWHDPDTKDRLVRLSEQGGGQYGLDDSGENADNNEDIAYMAKGWAYRYKK